MKSINSDFLKTIVLWLFIYFAQSTFAAEKCALSSQLTDSSKKVHCLDKFEFSKRKYSNLRMPLISATRSSNCWSLAIPNEASCKNIIGFSAQDPLWCTYPEVRGKNNKSAVSMCEEKGCKCSLVIDANDIVDEKLFFSYAMGETDLVSLSNTGKEVKESIGNKSDLDNSQSEKNQSVIIAEKEKQAQQELKLAQELKAIEDTKAKLQQELKLAQEAKAREDAVSEARQNAQQELRKSQEAEAREAALAKLKADEYEKEKQSAAAKARVLEEIKAEAYAEERAILEAKAKAQADLKAEEIAKKQAEAKAKAQALIDEKNRVAAAKAAEEQAKAQALIDEKNRVAAAKAAAEQAKKNREQEISEEKRKITESQKKIEELKNKPLEIENSKLNKPSPNLKNNAERAIASNSKEEKKQNLKSRKAQDELQIEFPYFAVIRCYPGMQPEIRHMMLSPCFAGGGNNSFETNLEINNGSDYGLFTGHAVESQIAQLGTVSQEGVRILLRKNFKISAQNAHDYFVLNITIYDAKTNNIIEQKSASLYGYIGFRN